LIAQRQVEAKRLDAMALTVFVVFLQKLGGMAFVR